MCCFHTMFWMPRISWECLWWTDWFGSLLVWTCLLTSPLPAKFGNRWCHDRSICHCMQWYYCASPMLWHAEWLCCHHHIMSIYCPFQNADAKLPPPLHCNGACCHLSSPSVTLLVLFFVLSVDCCHFCHLIVFVAFVSTSWLLHFCPHQLLLLFSPLPWFSTLLPATDCCCCFVATLNSCCLQCHQLLLLFLSPPVDCCHFRPCQLLLLLLSLVP